MAAEPLEVTKDIIVAMINRQSSLLGTGAPEAAAKAVAEAFATVYDTVKKKYNNV